ncbi:MAG: manganese efflux pump MntP family protein [Bacteroidales bacterium]|nr:manganese efflux pump MntP family protein [Bacteroidales bacterium]
MSFITLLLIAIGLSMDSLSVSVASGIFMKQFSWRESFKIASVFALFQGGLTALGWLMGINFSNYITSIDHWVAFILLLYLGGKMIYESFKEGESSISSLSFKTLATLGLATSIDAMAVGVGMAFLKTEILYPVSVITITTFIFSVAGLFFGSRFGKIKFINIELVGGIILIGIGVKILLEHLLG